MQEYKNKYVMANNESYNRDFHSERWVREGISEELTLKATSVDELQLTR